LGDGHEEHPRQIARRIDLTLEEAYGVARDMLNGIDEAWVRRY
jgi:hypothetical protein